MVLIGCTEIENLDQLSELGMTEMHREVLEVYVYDESVTPSAPHPEGSNLTWSNFVM